MSTTDATHHIRGALRCAGCDTLWKIPPAAVAVTIARISLGRWQDSDPISNPVIAKSDTPCPLCGSRDIDVMRCEINAQPWSKHWFG